MLYDILIKTDDLSVEIKGETTPQTIEGLINSINGVLFDDVTESNNVPVNINESIQVAKRLGYAHANKSSFSSAHKVAAKMPNFVRHLGMEGFITWYRNIEEETQPKKRLKQVSLIRYFDSIKG